MEEERLTEPIIHPPAPTFPDVAGKSLNEVLDGKEDTFQQRLFKLIDERGLDDVTIYKKANIDRKVFSRIRCKEDYKPKKENGGGICHRAGAGYARHARSALAGGDCVLAQQQVRPDRFLFCHESELRYL